MHISELVFSKKKIFYFAMLAILIGGIFSYQKIGKLEDPEINVMLANVVTVYPGASAHEVEMQVSNVLEDELSALADIKSIRARSEANVSVIEVELEMDVPQDEIPQRWEFLRRKLELAMPKLPSGVQTPMVIDDIGDVYGMFYAMVADDGYSYKEMSDYADLIKRNMLEVDGVSKVSIYGEQSPEVLITFSADKLSKMGVLPIQIIMAVRGHTKMLYAGSLYSGDQQLRVKVNDKANDIEDIRNLLVTSTDGSPVKLSDLATIEIGYNDPLKNTFYVNNKKAIGIGMSMESGENILEVGERVSERLDQIKEQIPAGISFVDVFSQPDKVKISIKGFMKNLIMSVIIVIVVLMFTMGFRSGVIIGTGLVLTILATFPLLMTAGGTLQRISLGAFIVAMGMLVDNAIVVLDGILIEKGRGIKGRDMYTKTAKQTAIPLLGATIIAIAAFFPVYLSPDSAGTYVRDLFVVLAISLSISWILALTQVPIFASWFFGKEKKKKKNEKAADETDMFDKPLYRAIKRTLAFALHHRLTTILVSVILLIGAMLLMKHVDDTFFPDFNYNQCYIEYTLPKGSTPDMVNEDLAEITDYFNSFDEVAMVVTSQGMTPMRYCLVRGMMTENADNYGEFIVNFADYETMKKMRPIFEEYLHSHYPEARSRIRNYNLTIESDYAVEAQFTGPDPAVLKRLSQEVQDMYMKCPYVNKYTVCDDWEPKAKTLVAMYDPIAANGVSMTRSDVSNAILTATDGLPIGKIYQGETPYPVRMRVRDKDGKRIEDLNDIPVWGTFPKISSDLNSSTLMGLYTGAVSVDELIKENITSVPLSAVTNGVQRDWEEPVVRRLNGTRVIQAQCDPLLGVSSNLIQKDIQSKIDKMDIPLGYEFKWVGEAALKTDAMKGILSFIPLAAGIIVLVLLLLFNDYRRPLIVLLCLPMALVGIAPGLFLTGQPFSFVAIVGVIGLTGMIIKNAIVLLDEIQLRLHTDKSRYHAVLNASVSRVRPVILASLTTILGMIPLLNDPMYASMSVAIISGLIVGTLITLLFVPVLYSVFFGLKLHKNDEDEV